MIPNELQQLMEKEYSELKETLIAFIKSARFDDTLSSWSITTMAKLLIEIGASLRGAMTRDEAASLFLEALDKVRKGFWESTIGKEKQHD